MRTRRCEPFAREHRGALVRREVGPRSSDSGPRVSFPVQCSARLPHISDELDTVWAEARSDAEAEGLDVRLYAYDQLPRNNIPLAATFFPGKTPSPMELEPLSPGDRQEILRNPALHRITVFSGIDADLLAPKLRHELEHVRQWEHLRGRADPAFELALLVHECQYERYGGLPAGGHMYNLVPIEQDANGAAARFSRGRDPTRADELARTSKEAVLFRAQPPPEPFGTLAIRLVCTAIVYRVEFQRKLGHDRDRFLDAADPSGSELWSRLRADNELNERSEAIARSRPRKENLESLPDPAEGWHGIKEDTLGAVDRARNIAGIGPRPVA
jgi:hypothetical protein